ncbi:MAG: disulfide bond formation protein B [Rhizomicrobium sp.]|jgi:disulfide bond formation protein DsbB
MMQGSKVGLLLGSISLALILGALGFQYIGHYPPCELCHWQRWPHIASAVVGLGGGLLVRSGILGPGLGKPLAALTVLLVAIAGALGVYHAGVEWHFWLGPQHCTGDAYHFTGGKLDFNAPVVMCDRAAWRLFGISMAGYNAVISLVAAGMGTYMLAQSDRRA